jgi:hypothetical protein
LLVGAKYSHQQRLAREFGATEALPPDQLARAVRRHSHSLSFGGADRRDRHAVGRGRRGDRLRRQRRVDHAVPGHGPAPGTVALVGMPGKVTIDLAPLWHREVRLAGAYAYGTESVQVAGRSGAAIGTRRKKEDRSNLKSGPTQPQQVTTFSLAFEVVAASRPAAWSRPPTPWPLRRGRGPRGRRRDGAAPSRSPSTSRKDTPDEPPSRFRPRGGQVHAADPVLERRGLHARTLPEGSRVIYAPEPMKALDDPYGAIRHALLHPVGDRDPLPALLHAGMKLTICFDDISLPLPPMEAPDIRQMVIETVLDMAADAGVDDVMLIAALALHRRMTENELRHALGDRVYDAFAPHGLLTQHDAEDPDNLIHLGETDRARTSRSTSGPPPRTCLVYVNINLVAMDGGHKSVATGLASYGRLRHHHNPQTMQHSRSFMDAPRRSCTARTGAWGASSPTPGVKIFQIETTLNTDTFPSSFAFLQKREWEWNLRDRASYAATSRSLKGSAARLARQIFHSIESPHAMTSVQAGEVEAVHALTTENVWKQQGVDVQGQTDILTMGLPYICPYNVNSIMNPILVACLGLGYFFNLYRGKPLVREGGVLIMRHPTRPEFHPGHHPSYIDFYEQVLTQTVDPVPSTSSSRSRSPPTRGTSTSTAPGTPITASTPSTCGTGARTRWSISDASSSSAAMPRPCAGSGSHRRRR